jgi:hypothetical protein
MYLLLLQIGNYFVLLAVCWFMSTKFSYFTRCYVIEDLSGETMLNLVMKPKEAFLLIREEGCLQRKQFLKFVLFFSVLKTTVTYMNLNLSKN